MVEVFYTRNKYNLMKNRHSLMQLAMANILHAHDPTQVVPDKTLKQNSVLKRHFWVESTLVL